MEGAGRPRTDVFRQCSPIPSFDVAKTEPVRFAFRLVDGPDAGLSCGGWRVWTHDEGTYITAKSLRDTWKVSLHGDAWWAAQVNKENAQRADTVLPTGHDRAMWRFQPTAFVGGHRVAFAIGAFRHALRPEAADSREALVGVPDRWDVLSLALVRMTEPDVEPDPTWQIVGGPLPLASGRRVWVTCHAEEIGRGEPEPMADSTMIEPWTPETHGVASPGWIVKGVHIDWTEQQPA